jgi:hypothetical protein
MNHKKFIDKIQSDFILDKNALLISDWQSTKQSSHEYDPETYVFCEIITAKNNKRNIIRLSASNIKNDEIPPSIIIDVLNVIFRGPSHPNIYKQENCFKTIFNGYLSNDGKDSELSFPLLLSLLNNIEGFF